MSVSGIKGMRTIDIVFCGLFAAAMTDSGLSRVNAVCIGRQTAAEARARGMRTWISEKATLESLVKRVEEAACELTNDEKGEN